MLLFAAIRAFLNNFGGMCSYSRYVSYRISAILFSAYAVRIDDRNFSSSVFTF